MLYGFWIVSSWVLCNSCFSELTECADWYQIDVIVWFIVNLVFHFCFCYRTVICFLVYHLHFCQSCFALMKGLGLQSAGYRYVAGFSLSCYAETHGHWCRLQAVGHKTQTCRPICLHVSILCPIWSTRFIQMESAGEFRCSSSKFSLFLRFLFHFFLKNIYIKN